MAFTLNRDDAEPRPPGPEVPGSPFSVSSDPVVAAAGLTGANAVLQDADLPRSYGTQTLWLMPRDPHSLFAYWDIDWDAAFRDEVPKNRKVYLRVLNVDGAEQAKIEVEPMAGTGYVTVPEADESYLGEIGYYQAAGNWISVASSAAVESPPDQIAGAGEAADFATVPFHLSFQRMLDQIRVAKHESRSLTSMLADLRARASPEQSETFTPDEHEFVRAMNAASATPRHLPDNTGTPDLWVGQNLERVLGFGATSPASGFGGSSRAS